MIAAEHAYETEIDQIVAETFQTMLATDVVTSSVAPASESAITALISFAGDWKGVLTFECGPQPAICFAQRFLQDEGIRELNGDVCDSLGELANIVAGNLKSVLAAGLSLGTPSVVEGKDYHVCFCGGRLISLRTYVTDVGLFTIRLIENAALS